MSILHFTKEKKKYCFGLHGAMYLTLQESIPNVRRRYPLFNEFLNCNFRQNS